MTFISSPANPTIKAVEKLSKSRERKKQKRFVVEGFREIDRALKSDYNLLQFFYCEQVDSEKGIEELKIPNSASFFTLDKKVFEKLSYRSSTEACIAVFEEKPLSLSSLHLPENPLIVILENIEKPGNIGAVLRTAAGLGVDAVLLANCKADKFNPNCIRSSLGAVFQNNVVSCSNQEALSFCQKNHIQLVGTYLHTEHSISTLSFRKPTALILGSEDQGISSFWVQQADALCKLEMHGLIDSLNISVAAALFVYEATRQRQNQ